MASNGRLPASTLAAIPGGRLRRDAAVAWNAMVAEARSKYGVTLMPAGSMSSYRTYSQQQYFWNLYRSGRGNLAAYPGTSNHGEGLAVDLATREMRGIIDRIGAKRGWSKATSDAPSEWWHLKWRPGTYKANKGPRTLRRGQTGPTVKTLQKILRGLNVKGAPRPTGYFSLATKRAVQRFQRKHGLSPDGVVGPKTWQVLRRRS